MRLSTEEQKAVDDYMGLVKTPTYSLTEVPEPVKDEMGITMNTSDIDKVKSENLLRRARWVRDTFMTYLRVLAPEAKFAKPNSEDVDEIIRICADMCIDNIDVGILAEIRQMAVAHESITNAFTSLGLSARDWAKSQTALQKQKALNKAVADLQASREYRDASYSSKATMLEKVTLNYQVPNDPVVQILGITAIDLPRKVRRRIAVQRQTDPASAAKAAEDAVQQQRCLAASDLQKARSESRIFDITQWKSPKYMGEETA